MWTGEKRDLKAGFDLRTNLKNAEVLIGESGDFRQRRKSVENVTEFYRFTAFLCEQVKSVQKRQDGRKVFRFVFAQVRELENIQST